MAGTCILIIVTNPFKTIFFTRLWQEQQNINKNLFYSIPSFLEENETGHQLALKSPPATHS
jgi:hypothetical protein